MLFYPHKKNKQKARNIMTYNTVIFDLDGTLLNTLDDIKDSVNYALNKFNYPLRTLEEVRKSVGNGAKILIDNVVPPNTSTEDSAMCLEVYKEHYAHNSQNKTRPYDGILSLLKLLYQQDIKLAIVSNKFDFSVKELCRIYFGEYIHVAIGESANVARKPAPDSIYTAIKELDSVKSRVIYVGDSDVDVQTAHNAGIPCIGVTWGFRDREVLEKAGADSIINKPEEITNYL
jgi:phosphoglycolate phosphatase